MIVNPDVDGYQTTPEMIAYCFNQRVPKFFRAWLKSELVNILRPKSQTAYVDMTKMLIVWMIFGSRLLNLFSVSAVYSFLKYLRCTTIRQANKFEELRLRFRFWSPRRDLFSDPLRNRNLCLVCDPYYGIGKHWLQRLNLSKRFRPVLICRCVSLHRILQGVKCSAQTITTVPAAGMARKRSYHLQPRCWNEHRWFNFSVEFQTDLLNWLCKARKEVVVSLPNFHCILISKSLSNLKLKHTTVFKHKRIHNCITHSKVSKNIIAADAGNVPPLWAIITSHKVCTFKMMYCVPQAVATTSILDSFDDC